MKDSKLLAQKELELKQYKTNLKATIRYYLEYINISNIGINNNILSSFPNS